MYLLPVLSLSLSLSLCGIHSLTLVLSLVQVDENFTVKVADFGLAHMKRIGEEGQRGNYGTIGSMSLVSLVPSCPRSRAH